MNKFAALLDHLLLTPSRNGKLRLLTDYFQHTQDPDRGWAVAAIAGDLDIRSVKPAMLRELIYARMDQQLFDLSYDYVGDLAETISLVWPAQHGANTVPSLTDVIEGLDGLKSSEALQLVTQWLNALQPAGRWALLKLITGGLRIGVASRLVKVALAEYGDKPVQEIEELWHGLTPPYAELFDWLDGKSDKPRNLALAPFRPAMLAHALKAEDRAKIELDSFYAEWKWDGIRVQAVSEGGTKRLYSRTGDDISDAFPDIVKAINFEAAIDGELLIFDPNKEPFQVLPFGELQKRLNRKKVSAKLQASHPAFIRAYDLLWHAGTDLRNEPFEKRRRLLETLITEHHPERIDQSELLRIDTWDALEQARSAPPDYSIEGIMLKQKASAYLPGRPKGLWWKWKQDPHLVDAVLMYAQRGHGKRSGFYSDYTFGVWRESETGDELVPVGKAYFGFTDEELKQIDKFVRNNTIERFGPVRSVKQGPEDGLVLEVAFEGLKRSSRHKSGVAMRFPRINRLRWDKPAREADRLETLEAMLPGAD